MVFPKKGFKDMRNAVVVKVEPVETSQSDETADLNRNELPRLPHDVLIGLAKFLDFKSLKAARAVDTEWNKALAGEFRKKAILNTDFGYEKSIYDFVNVFSPDATTDSKLIAQSIWIRKPKYLKNESMIKWLEKYGQQLTTVKLGMPTDNDHKVNIMSKQAFHAWMIGKLLLFCPNLKVLSILFPYSEYSCDSTDFDPEKTTVKLDLLTIGYVDNNNGKSCCTPPSLKGTSNVLRTVLKCLTSLETLKIMNVVSSSFDRIEVPSPRYDHGKKVLEDIMELDMITCTVHPQHLLGPNITTKYQNLRRLQFKTICCTQVPGEEIVERNLRQFLDSVKDDLKELTFDYLRCVPLHSIPTMPKLEVLRISMYTDSTSLNFLNQLPALKRLEINSEYNPSLDELFINNKAKNNTNRVRHENLKELQFRGYKKSSEDTELFDAIGTCFPNLEKLEIAFYGTDINPLMVVLGKYKNIRNLKLHVCSELKINYLRPWVTACAIEKLCLEYEFGDKKLPLNLSWIVHGFLKSGNLQELELIDMRIFKEEYDFVIKKISTTNLKLRHSSCDIRPM